MSEHYKERLLKQFNFNEPDNVSGSELVPLQVALATPLASINLDDIREHDRVLLKATVGWLAATTAVPLPEVQFALRRDDPSGIIVFSTIDTYNSTAVGTRFTTTLSHAERNLSPGSHQFALTGQIITGVPLQIDVIGPVDLSGLVIAEND